ncbi:energy transducer TonB [Blastopirellula marina]|nr:energy transducer TonB [Blastopirellula marina]
MVFLLAMGWQSSSIWVSTEFAGERQAVNISATFAPPTPLSEPEPVEVVQSEMDAAESTTNVAPNATIVKQSLDLRPTVQQSSLLVAPMSTPEARRDQRRQFKHQPDQVEPQNQPLRRKTRKLEVASLAQAKPAPLGTSKKIPPDFSNNPSPHYPVEAQRNGWKGEVLLRLTIDVDGTVSQVTIVKSSGYPILDEAAVKAVRSWRGVPTMQGGEPIVAQWELPIRFLPKGAKSR